MHSCITCLFICLLLTCKKAGLNAVCVKSENNTDLCIDIQCITFQRLQDECVELENVFVSLAVRLRS